MKKQHSPALTHILHAWEYYPHGSWQRLNSAMGSTLMNAISHGMRFGLDDFRHLSQHCRMSYWCGDLESRYAEACGCDRASHNPSAVNALEYYFGRPGFLWAEENRTPSRLYVGAKFTWEGVPVKVTSFNDDKKQILARELGSRRDDNPDIEYFDGEYRLQEMLKRYPDGTRCVRYGPPIKTEDDGKTYRLFRIHIDELKDRRKAYDDKRKEVIKEITATKTLAEMDAVRDRIAGYTTRTDFRHFDLDILREEVTKQFKKLEEECPQEARERYQAQRLVRQKENLAKWTAGEYVSGDLDIIRLRIKGNRVEVTNGNSITIQAARATLAFALKHRKTGWHQNGDNFDVDSFRLEEVHPTNGVKVGCTRVPWEEVDRFKKILKKAK